MFSVFLVILSILVATVINWWFSSHGKIFRDTTIPCPPVNGLIYGHAKLPNGDSMYTDEGAEWFLRNGKKFPTFRFRLGIRWFLVTSDVEVVKKVFKMKTSKTWYYMFMKKWLGDGLLLSAGDKWYRRRKLLTPSFHFDILKTYIDIFNETTNTLVDLLGKEAGKEVEVFPKALSMTLDTILRCLVDHHSDCQTQCGDYATLMYKLSEMVIGRMFHPPHFLDIPFHMTSTGAEYRKLTAQFREMSIRIIEERKRRHEEDPEILSDPSKQIFLDVLLTKRYEDGTMLSLEDVLEEVNVFIFEGHDTTASGISWSLFLLSQHPDHLQKCCEEIRETFTEGTDYVTQAQINSLTHFGQCVKECLRLRPPVPYIGRQVETTTEIGGITIPADMSVMILIDAIHRKPEYWTDPDEFRPERFGPEASRGRDPYCYLPFSAGSRNCIGQVFAQTELKMGLAKILYHFDIHSENPGNVSRFHALISKPVNLNMRFVPRETAS